MYPHNCKHPISLKERVIILDRMYHDFLRCRLPRFSALPRLLYQRFGLGGAINRAVEKKLESSSEFRQTSNKRGKNRKLLIRFDTRTGPGIPWNFDLVQSYVVTRPGDSTLAFFTAENTSSHPMTGLSTYTILPFKAAPYGDFFFSLSLSYF